MGADRQRAVRGRLAPSPTGDVHLGTARTALAAWLAARARNGELVWRLEDIDTVRVVAGAAEAAARDLAWLGLDWDEGPERGGRFAPYEQSRRAPFYDAALDTLAERGFLFPCARTRRELTEAASAPHGPAPAYPARLRPRELASDWFARWRDGHMPDVSLRFRVDAPTSVAFDDAVQGACHQDVAASVGDFVLRRRDGLWAYQLAVVVDDAAMEITEVVRGADLLDSTARQILLARALGVEPPAWAHVPLVRNAQGDKLSKRDGAMALRRLAEVGCRREQVTGYLAWSLGLIDRPCAVAAAELVPVFDWARIGREDFRVPDDAPERIASLR
jgi:glutamyl-tRNA synthetase